MCFMEVKTKYEFGDKVWYITANRVMCGEITGFSIAVDKDGPRIKYWVGYDKTFHDNELFDTKQALLNTL